MIPAHPLALNANRQLNEANQRGLTRYYAKAGAGGIAVAVHTTQFTIREHGLLEPVLKMAIEEWKPIGAKTRTPFQVERVATMFGHYDKFGLSGGNGRVLAMILGRKPTSYRDFAARVARERGFR